jgi:uncharacterized damage-inducible protein DinB
MSTPARAEIERLREQLRRAVHGDAWHGPSLIEAFADLPPDVAWTRPSPDTHSPVEMVLHVAAWFDIVRRRLAGDVVSPTTDEDWPPAPEQRAAECAVCMRLLLAAHTALDDALASMDDSHLDDATPGQRVAISDMLHGVVQHTSYHTGQIMLVRRTAAL